MDKNDLCECSSKDVVIERIHHDTKQPTVKLQQCIGCGKYEKIWQNDRWTSLEDVYRNFDTCQESLFFRKVSTAYDRLVLYLLAQVSHNQYDYANEKGESPFTLYAHDEIATLCFYDGQVVGFFTIKQQGTPIEPDSLDFFSMNMVDTMYVRKPYRGQGLGIAMLSHIVDLYPNQYLGFSDPVSTSMCKLLKKYLKRNPTLRDKFWLCSFTGEEGYRENIWLMLSSSLSIKTSVID